MADARLRTASQPQDSPFRVLSPQGPPLAEWADEDLMLAHGEGSEEAFEELVRRHQKGVLNFTYRMVQNRQVAEELTQDVFLALVKNAQRYEPRAKFTTYLYAIASNIVSKEWLRRKRRPMLLSFWNSWRNDPDSDSFDPFERIPDDKACVETAFQREEINEAVNAALQQLPDHQREAFVLRRFQDVPYDEIAQITNTPVGTIKSRVVRAEHALRPLLSRFREYI